LSGITKSFQHQVNSEAAAVRDYERTN